MKTDPAKFEVIVNVLGKDGHRVGVASFPKAADAVSAFETWRNDGFGVEFVKGEEALAKALSFSKRIDDERIPDGWYVEKHGRTNSMDQKTLSMTKLEIYEEGGATWRDSDVPRSVIDVEIFWSQPSFLTDHRTKTEISWPSTSDKRPAVAKALAVALLIAAEMVEEAEVVA